MTLMRSAADPVGHLRGMLPSLAPYPRGCMPFEGRRLMSGTAFFPGGDGLWKPNLDHQPAFPINGVLVFGI